MKPVLKIYFKQHSSFKEEQDIASKYFQIADCRTALNGHTSSIPIIAKYSVANGYKEYCKDLKNLGLIPINSPIQSEWSSKISCWYHDLYQFTPQTWFNPFENPIIRNILKDHNGPFFVRYDTKSKRELWKTHAYAADFKSLIDMSQRLTEDYKFDNEIVAVREFKQFKTYSSKNDNIYRSFSGQPIIKEFRIHRLLKQELCRHFYWEPFQEEIENEHGSIHSCDVPTEWLKQVTDIADSYSNFYALDIAQLPSGEWMVIEINEGQQAGIHTDYLDLYYNKMNSILMSSFVK